MGTERYVVLEVLSQVTVCDLLVVYCCCSTWMSLPFTSWPSQILSMTSVGEYLI